MIGHLSILLAIRHGACYALSCAIEALVREGTRIMYSTITLIAIVTASGVALVLSLLF